MSKLSIIFATREVIIDASSVRITRTSTTAVGGDKISLVAAR
jgi:hypothetical protein